MKADFEIDIAGREKVGRGRRWAWSIWPKAGGAAVASGDVVGAWSAAMTAARLKLAELQAQRT